MRSSIRPITCMTVIPASRARAIGVCCRAPPTYAAQFFARNAGAHPGAPGPATPAATTAASSGSTKAR